MNSNLNELIRNHLKYLRDRQELSTFSKDVGVHIATLSLFANGGRKSLLLSTAEPVLARMILDGSIDLEAWIEQYRDPFSQAIK